MVTHATKRYPGNNVFFSVPEQFFPEVIARWADNVGSHQQQLR